MLQHLNPNTITVATAVTSDNGAPTGAVGGEFGDFEKGLDTSHYLLKVVLTGTGALSMELFQHASDSDAGTDWGPLGDADGQLNAAAAITGTTKRVYWQVITNLGFFKRYYIEVLNLTGTGASVEITLQQIENIPEF